MNIPFKVKLLTPTAKAPERANDGDLWDLFADSFDLSNIDCIKTKTKTIIDENGCLLTPNSRVLIKTGIALDLPRFYQTSPVSQEWLFDGEENLIAYAVADLRPRSGLALKNGITVLNAPATIDNSYRKEIGVILINNGLREYHVEKGAKIAQMLIRPLYPSEMEIVDNIDDTGRGGYGSTGK